MIVISILALLILKGTALTRSWIDRSQVTSTLSSLKETIDQAKVHALRNTANQPMTQAAIYMCFDQAAHRLSVIQPQLNSTAPACSTTHPDHTLLSQVVLAKDIQLERNQLPFQCLAFHPSGLVMTTDTTCAGSATLQFKVTKHDETADITLM